MKWWPSKKKPEETEEKLNPAQHIISRNEGPEIYSRENYTDYRKQYEQLEIVNRGINMIVDDASDIPVEIGDPIKGIVPVAKGVRKHTLYKLLNFEPNPFQDISTFRRNIITDYLLDGNIFIYYDGVHLYHLPANKVVIHTDPKTYISGYTFDGLVDYGPEEIIHVKDNSFYSMYRGISRLKAATKTMYLLERLRRFQLKFFTNGAVPGLVLKSPDVLSDKIKDRMLETWTARYSPEGGGRRPMILDGGLEIDSISNVNFKELDFQSSCKECEDTILKALGVPPILLDSGNNANISPNLRLYFLETIIPIIRKVNAAYSRFFGYEIYEDATDVAAMQPALRDQAAYFSSLVNGGILTPNEARIALGKPPLEGCDEIRVPANITGSASNPDEGGRPPGDPDE